MTRIEDTTKVSPDDDLFTVLRLMTSEDLNQMPVVEDGRLLGMIARDRVLGLIALRTELGAVRQVHSGTK